MNAIYIQRRCASKLENIIGHEFIRNGLKRAINQGTLSHGHIISGKDGIGKSIIARELALNILGKTIERDYADIIVFKSKGKSLGVDYIRQIIEEATKKPFEGDKKVIIIYEGDKITTQGQNALLKTIEEPPLGVNIIILCENVENILETIRSRCQTYKLNPLSSEDMKKYIKNKFTNLNDEEMDILLAFGEGIPGRVDNYMINKDFKDIRSLTLNILKDINSKDMNIVTNYVRDITEKHKDYYNEVLDSLLFYVRDVIIYKELNDEKYVLNRDKIIEIKNLAVMMSFNKLNSVIQYINKARNSIAKNVNPVMVFDVMLINMLEG